MSQAQQVTTTAAAKPKRPRKAVPAHPKFIDMVTDAIGTLKDRNGSSRQAICKAILARYPSVNPDTMNSHVRRALKRGLQTGVLTRPARSSATGATGRFKVGVVKPVKAAKKKAAKRPTKKRPTKKAGPTKATAKPKASPKKKKAAAGKKKTSAKKSAKPKINKSSPKKKAKSTATTKAKKVARKPKAKKSATKKPTKK